MHSSKGCQSRGGGINRRNGLAGTCGRWRGGAFAPGSNRRRMRRVRLGQGEAGLMVKRVTQSCVPFSATGGRTTRANATVHFFCLRRFFSLFLPRDCLR